MTDVNLTYVRTESQGSYYADVDYPNVEWQKTMFEEDTYDCVVCDFPIDPGMHFGCMDDGSENAHRWCVTIKE